MFDDFIIMALEEAELFQW